MHTKVYSNKAGQKFFIHYNSDLSEYVILDEGEGDSYRRFVIDGDILLQFIGEVIRDRKINQLERMSGKEILGID